MVSDDDSDHGSGNGDVAEAAPVPGASWCHFFWSLKAHACQLMFKHRTLNPKPRFCRDLAACSQTFKTGSLGQGFDLTSLPLTDHSKPEDPNPIP